MKQELAPQKEAGNNKEAVRFSLNVPETANNKGFIMGSASKEWIWLFSRNPVICPQTFS